MARARFRTRRRTTAIGGATVAAVVLAVTMLWFWPAPAVASHGEILTRVAADDGFRELVAADSVDPELLPECRSARYDPAGEARGVVLLLHGYTSCPHQFDAVAKALADDGYVVLAPRWPGHGYAHTILERGAVDLGAIARFGDRMVDIASGISRSVTVVGLSGGGTLALWLAANRPEIDRTVALAPMLNPAIVPTWLSRPAGNLLSVLPSFPIWWDFDLREKAQVPRYSYAQWQTHSIATFMAMGRSVVAVPRGSHAQTIVVVNDADDSVDNDSIEAAVDSLRRDGAAIDRIRLPARLGLPHEYIDAEDPHNDVTRILPPLVRLIETGKADELNRL